MRVGSYSFGHIDGINTYRMSCLDIAASNEGRIIATFHFAVEAYYGYPLLSYT